MSLRKPEKRDFPWEQVVCPLSVFATLLPWCLLLAQDSECSHQENTKSLESLVSALWFVSQSHDVTATSSPQCFS